MLIYGKESAGMLKTFGIQNQSRHKKGKSKSEVVITITFIAHKTPMLPKLRPLSIPSIAFLLRRISTSITGIITGKLNMAISVPLLPAFEAMADIIVNTVEKLRLPNSTVKK